MKIKIFFLLFLVSIYGYYNDLDEKTSQKLSYLLDKCNKNAYGYGGNFANLTASQKADYLLSSGEEFEKKLKRGDFRTSADVYPGDENCKKLREIYQEQEEREARKVREREAKEKEERERSFFDKAKSFFGW
jgi:hypothetical protein